jgi:redox-sensing transcriptional repressor
LRWKKISDAVIRRLPLYLRVLDELSADPETELISSQDLGFRAGVSPALVRKDLAWFGEFGKQGVGYEVAFLRDELRRILNLDSELKVALVGVGSLGVALTRYNIKRYQEDNSFNLRLAALFDSDPKKIGIQIEGIPVFSIDQIGEKTEELGLQMAIITVPFESAQIITDMLVNAGVRAILNFAPTKLVVPEGVHVSNADLSLELQRLAYYLQDEE